MSQTSRFWPVSRAIAKALTIPGTNIGPRILVDIQDKLDDEQDKRAFIAVLGELKNHLQEIRGLLKGEFTEDQLEGIEDTIPVVAEGFYRREIANEYMYLDFKGIHQTQRAFDIPLDDVFVDLEVQRLPRSVVGDVDPEEEHRRRLEAAADDVESEQIEDEIVQQDLERHEASKPELEQSVRLDVEALLKEPGGVVVLGDPGSGKTTLVKRLARQMALGPDREPGVLAGMPPLFPVVIPITAYDEGGCGRSLFDFIRSLLSDRFGAGVDGVFMDHWAAGQCLFLLDGLDEVAKTGQRIAVARKVEQFVRDLGENRAIVTSRPYGYSICRLSSPREHTSVLPFSADDMERFAKNWYGAFEKVNHPDAPNDKNAERDASALIDEIRANKQVESLATNPFMMTIIAVVKQQHVRLPDHRVKVYDLATKTLIETWHFARHLHIQGASGDEEIGSEDFRAVVEELAYWMHATKSTGTYQKSELQSRLRDLLMEQGLHKHQAIKQAEEYLRVAIEQSGLLLPRGQNHLAFMHQTFQEYLAACHLVNRGSDQEAIESLLEVCLDGRWHEVVRLAVGIFGVINNSRKRASMVLNALMDEQGDRLEPILGRRLLLAASCLADDVRVEGSVVDRVIRQLIERCDDEASAAQALQRMQKVRPGSEAIEVLLGTTEHDNWEIRMEAIRMLARVADRDARIEPYLEATLDDNDLGVEFHAAWGLWREFGRRDDALVRRIVHGLASASSSMNIKFDRDLFRALIRLLEHESRNVRFSAAETLGSWGHQAEAVPALIRLLENEKSHLRFRAAETLGSWGHQAEAVPDLIRLLEDESRNVRLSAAETLGSWGHQTEAVPILIRLLEDEDSHVRFSAAETLGSWGHQAEAVPALIRLLEDEDSLVRISAAETLGSWGHQAEAVPALIRFLEDEVSHVRFRAAETLGSWGHQAEAVPDLIRLLEDEDSLVRFRAAETLGSWGHQAEAVPDLIRLLDDEVTHVRLRAAETLGSWGHQAEAVPDLIRLLEDEDSHVRLSAAQVLAAWESR